LEDGNQEETLALLSAEEFRKWAEEQHRLDAQRNMRTWGFNIFVIGLATLSLALALLQTLDLDQVTYLQILGLSFTAIVVGLMLVFLSPWAASKNERLAATKKEP